MNNTFFTIKQYSLDFAVVLGLSFFSKFWQALSSEFFSAGQVAHVLVLLIVAILVRLLGRWIGEEIDSFSDIQFVHRFTCERNVFELLKQTKTHGRLFRQNIDFFVFDEDKLLVYSKFMFVKTTETFQVLHSERSVILKNISGKYESSATYEYDGTAIVAHFVSKPKGIRRVMALLFFGVAKRTLVEDFNKFVKENS